MIIPGSATVANGVVKLVPPAGFNSAQAVRLANFLATPVVLTNLDGQGQSQQLLMPVQQNIYAAPNISNPATVTDSAGVASAATIAANLYVEWSTDPQTDFATGVYPCPVSVPAATVAQAIFAQGVPNVLLTKTVLATGTFAQLAAIDFTGYASVNLLISSNGNTYQDILEFDWSGFGAGGGSWLYQWNDVGGGGLVAGQSMTVTLPVHAANLTVRSIANNAGYVVTAVASNRPVNDAQFDGTVAINFNGNQAWAGETVLQIYGGTNNQSFHTRGGWHYLSAFITGASKGRIQLKQCAMVHATGKSVSLTDSGEWHTGSDAVATQRIEKTVYIAPGIYALAWQADVAATYQVDVNMWSL